MDPEEQRRAQFQANIRAEFKRNAFLLINEMVEMASHNQDTSQLVDEILHSIFFLGEINRPKISPREIFDADVDMVDDLQKKYPEPFTRYSSRLPRRSPFSCVLDMVVHLKGQEHEDDIRETLQKLVQELKPRRRRRKPMLCSSSICISAGKRTNSVRHYGVSMSTTDSNSKIMIAASCLSFWEAHVAHAVSSCYYPVENSTADFDVTIQLSDVICKAFDLISRGEKSPCLFCRNMFGLTSDTQDLQTPKWPYGNCAEAESLSNLLREEEVRIQRNGNWTEENQERVKNGVRNELGRQLNHLHFEWDNQFYKEQ
ncbi:uncharacterized protein LOC116731730 [Xiphophorus hellerii]|uniref:uncharacterized protein LOC116731730 n=1 Tax=Xiphophorus hellerii TaxID=8084 RepID=UPI0013B376C3|nr:uncharacterized protein LOC116731730 [Xiphophorus hellerii]